MGVADHENSGRVRQGDRGEVGDVPGRGGPHLQDEEAGGLVGPQDGQGQADLVVEAGGRGMANCDEFIKKLPQSYYTLIGENGSVFRHQQTEETC